MKKCILLILFSILSLYTYSQELNLYSVSGIVKIKSDENSANWIIAKTGQKLSPGNIIFTGLKSEAIIQTKNAKIEVKALSQASVKSLVEVTDSIVTDVYIKYGKIKARVDKNKEVQTVFKVRSANSTASVRGTIFTFGNRALFVEDGTVQLENDYENSALVQKGEKAFVKKFDVIEVSNLTVNDGYFINPLPTGISDIEYDDTNGGGNSGIGSGTGPGTGGTGIGPGTWSGPGTTGGTSHKAVVIIRIIAK